MKKLNRKGFTLIELLAVIVIMAIILVVTVPNIINSISDARVNSLHNLAVSAAGNYDTYYAQDLIAIDSSKRVLGEIPAKVKSTWTCIGSIKGDVGGVSKTLADVLGLSKTDVILTAPKDVGVVAADNNIKQITKSNYQNYCSSARNNNGRLEIILVAASGGKYSVSGKAVYAYSQADNAVAK